ncbi:lipid IV(A) 3-deoxy-D-manno-octulosonic acid transferase [Thalassotalea sediminis]|uniref:lipid IV(A) 3-deoxy-D-manno-octulosonic acid transferase n=1 Tax=Thalassotalea sediminis TaxID=1759089 RepID=UPI00257432CD|nr:lipid IV(A) 3-deoxy-D-manno-octulosonic acid transferase [Thalassotalea sediminis]
MRTLISLLLYRIVLIVLTPVLLLVLIIRSRTNKAYRQRLKERIGWIPHTCKPNSLVIHAASVGEVIALKPLIQKLLARNDCSCITLTTFTPTGSEQVKKLFGNDVQHCYFPLDVWPCTWLFLHRLKPSALVLMETELWPNIIAQCTSKGIPLQLINGRLSDNSMKSYKKIAWLVSPCLKAFSCILTQSEEHKKNFIKLGSLPEKTTVSGNLKYDISITEETAVKSASLANYIEGDRKIWLVASTHPGDEALALASFSRLKQQHPSLLLILVPRHPERFTSVKHLCEDQQWHVVNRSAQKSVEHTHDIWLIDTLGELLACCALADIVTMGGSFSTIGGHNPLEPALFEKPIIVGHDMSNFREVTAQLLSAGGLAQLHYPSNCSQQILHEHLTKQVNQLLNDERARALMGQAALKVVKQNQGASALTCETIARLVNHN